MSGVNQNEKLQLPQRMQSKLEDFQRRVWIIKLAEGLLAAAFGLLLSYLLVFTLDRFLDTSAVLRGIILLVGSLGLGIWFPLVCHKWIWKSRRLEQVARLLRYKFPRLSDHLLGIIELVHNEDEASRSQALCRAALAQVDEETKDRDFTHAVPKPKHRRWALIAGVPAAIVVVAMLVVPAAGSNAFARWLMPWKNTERYTFAQLKPLPEKIVVPLAEKSNFNAELTESSRWSPTKASAVVGGNRISAQHENGLYEFSIPPLKQNSELKIAVGDARQKIKIEPKSRPEISAMIARIDLPDYLQRTEPIEKDIRGGTVATVGGSRVSFTANATRDLAEATVNDEPVGVEGQFISTAPVEVSETTRMEFKWTDSLGLTAKTPMNLKIRIDADQRPSLVCQKLGKQRVMLEKDVLSFNVSAEDDFGIKTIGMEWQGVPKDTDLKAPIKGEKIVSAGDPEATDLEAIATFSPTREKIKPQAIKLRLFVQDYLPDRERIYSPTYTVFVLSEEEHAIWLTRQLDQWYKQSLETYEREQQLFKRNIELRDLSAEEIDRPENRRRIEAQAAAENAQSRRLNALTDAGERLVKEATRNDQFNVETLEKLSEMLQGLKDISSNRMPSVADLLKKAADAPSGSSKESESGPSVSDNKGEPAGGKSGAKGSKVPSVGMKESSMDQKDPSEEEPGDEQESKGGGKFTLPSVTLESKADEACANDGGGGASPNMEAAVDEQEELLAEFQKIAEELKRIISNLEGSTFVKRLKAMSRRQIDLAQDINESVLGSFGFDEGSVKDATRTRFDLLAKREIQHGTTTTYIQDDLEAFANRVQQGKFKTVLDEMKNSEVIKQVREVSDKIISNASGSSIAHTEFLADTFDRWAEQLVGPG